MVLPELRGTTELWCPRNFRTIIVACNYMIVMGEIMSQENERIKSLSDVELELEAEHINSKLWRPGHPIRRELHRRRNQKEKENKQTQQAIKKMTFVILVMTAVILLLTIGLAVIAFLR